MVKWESVQLGLSLYMSCYLFHLTGLVSWREAVCRSKTTAQLAMTLYVLESCVAWDKSIMKAVSKNKTIFFLAKTYMGSFCPRGQERKITLNTKKTYIVWSERKKMTDGTRWNININEKGVCARRGLKHVKMFIFINCTSQLLAISI